MSKYNDVKFEEIIESYRVKDFGSVKSRLSELKDVDLVADRNVKSFLFKLVGECKEKKTKKNDYDETIICYCRDIAIGIVKNTGKLENMIDVLCECLITREDWCWLVEEITMIDVQYQVMIERVMNYILEKKDFSVAVKVLERMNKISCKKDRKDKFIKDFCYRVENVVRDQIKPKKIMFKYRVKGWKNFNDEYINFVRLSKKYYFISKGLVFKNRVFVGFGIVVCLGMLFLSFLGINKYTTKDIEFYTKDVNVTYGDELNLSDFSISEISWLNKARKKDVLLEYVEYDREKIGVQEAKIVYGDESESFKITITPRKFDAPVVSYLHDVVSWNENSYAKYFVYLNNEVIETSKTSINLNDYGYLDGNIEVKVKFVSISNKYSDSDVSNTISVSRVNQASVVTCDNNEIKWNAVTNAYMYEVWVNDKKYETTSNKLVVNNLIAGLNTIKVKAITNTLNMTSSSIYEKKINKLYPVSNIRSVDGKLMWDYDLDNCKYIISINGEKYESSQKEYSYTFNYNVTYNINVTVFSLDNSVINSDKTEFTYLTKQLTMPVVTYNNDIVSWNGQDNVLKYIVYLNGEEIETSQTSLDLSSYNSLSGEIIISVKAISSNAVYVDSPVSNEVAVTRIESVSSVEYENGYITWNTVSNASVYEVFVNGVKYSVSTNRLKFKEFDKDQNEVKVIAKAYDNEHLSSVAFTVQLNKAASVSDLKYENNKITWSYDCEDCSYFVRINDAIMITTSKEYYVQLAYNNNYEIGVTVASYDKHLVDSNEIKIAYWESQLVATSVSIVKGNYSDSYIIKIEEVENATNYLVNVKLYGPSNTYTFDYDITELTKDITVLSSITRIEVNVIAKDANNVHVNSEVFSCERSI